MVFHVNNPSPQQPQTANLRRFCLRSLQVISFSCYELQNASYLALTVCDIAGLVRTAHQRAMLPTDIVSGYNKSCIFSFDPNVFQDHDFSPSSVTNRAVDDRSQSLCDNINAVQVELLRWRMLSNLSLCKRM